MGGKQPNVDILVNTITDQLENKQRGEILHAIQDEDYFKLMKELRKDESKGWSKDRTLRHIATIPGPLYHKALRIWGPEVFSDKTLFKKAFLKDEVGQWTLTVPINTI